MVKGYSDFHNKWMKNYFNTSVGSIIDKSRVVYARNKYGYVVCINLLVKIFPDISRGIQIVAFINPIYQDTDVHILLFEGKTGTILGISESCESQLGIPLSITYGNWNHNSNDELYIQNLCPLILEKVREYNRIRDENGGVGQQHEMHFDTTCLQNFYIQEQEEVMDLVEIAGEGLGPEEDGGNIESVILDVFDMDFDGEIDKFDQSFDHQRIYKRFRIKGSFPI